MFTLIELAVAIYLAILGTRIPDGSTDFLHDPPATTSTTR